MIQFITNHPYWTGIIIYLFIGLMQGVQYYCIETFKYMYNSRYGIYSERDLRSEFAGIAFIYIFLWVIFLIADVWDLDTAIYNKYHVDNNTDKEN